MSNNKQKFVPEVVPKITPHTERYKADALATLERAREMVEDNEYHAVAIVLVDIDGVGTSMWSTCCHRMGLIGLIEGLKWRLFKKFEESGL